MSDSRFWRGTALAIVAGLFYVGSGLRSAAPLPTFAKPAYAGATAANDETEYIITSSADGEKVFMWRFYSSKPPKYLGKSEAIERR